jgi:hypothetical protein
MIIFFQCYIIYIKLVRSLTLIFIHIAIFLTGYSYFHSVMEFPRVMTACIIAYFALISIAQLFSWYVIQNKILIAAFRKVSNT